MSQHNCFLNRFYYFSLIIVWVFSGITSAQEITTPFGNIPSRFYFKKAEDKNNTKHHVKMTIDSEGEIIIANIDDQKQIKLSLAAITYLKSLAGMEGINNQHIFFALLVADTITNMPVATGEDMVFTPLTKSEYSSPLINIFGNDSSGLHSQLSIELNSSLNGFFPITYDGEIINYVINIEEVAHVSTNNPELDISQSTISVLFAFFCFCCSKSKCAS